MTADEFVSTIAGFRPTAAHAREHDLSEDDIEALRRPFVCALREPPRAARASAIEDLIVRYDCARLAIGRVRFIAAPRPHFAGSVVAFCESDPIVLLPSGELAVFEVERFGDWLMPCARDGAHLLDALAAFLGMFWERAAWLDRTDEAARRCAELAGGPGYEPFFVGLMGFLEYGAA